MAEIITFRKRETTKVAVSAAPLKRLEALDILRGLCVIGMILVAYAGDWGHRFGVLNHADWHGLALADMIFPGFLFCVGAAMPLSFSARAARQTKSDLALHILWRALALILLGVLLNFLATPDPAHFRVPGILQRIGLCYGAVGGFSLLIGRKSDVDFTLPMAPVFGAIIGFGALYAGMLLLWYAPDCGTGCFDSSHSLPAVVDRAVFGDQYMWPWGLTDGVVTFDPEGLVSTLGALINVLLGVLISLYIRQHGASNTLAGTFLLGLFLLTIGLGLDDKVPVIKKIWTPTFAMVSGGFTLILYAILSLVSDLLGLKAWAYPVKVFGANATLAFIAISLINIGMEWPAAAGVMNPHGVLAGALGSAIPDDRIASLAYSALLLTVVGLILLPLYRKRWFLKL